ncbi:helix-turn-helix domain-containing protein [Lactobacillus kefiranofaciens]|uniref:Helix-turn-helix domain-containing protein n=2 Tax=Lactobacillus kefiranofaciens TaxID=267818 RepID=A0AAX3UC64_9LACO|nr:helix-turn-helix domain-containing protein [Lactobacillus kefiranofaciens]AEG41445.1 Transposase [Lactobacillus kefiranofaciens subsp. kefiranofaciens]KRM19460.1 transposase [Lactobacillus kefiranofaciens subsp. kefiranofaciens DSM 5016 = JCM 6985]QFQ67168.1 helix-turn-helix domain-containing protein [Lactobacillus kefiranofaciens subsp. kefiranofaciens]WGO85135.1 helix-turn-helix domain-containing protein [Lactobacillus kefiranofaciens]WQH35585.1 helix-turn-helix domain-containing protein 
MIFGVKLKLYPNQAQQNLMEKMIDNSRFVWNKTLAMMNDRYENNPKAPRLGEYALNYLMKPFTIEYPFLKIKLKK